MKDMTLLHLRDLRAPLQKSRQNHGSYVWTEALDGMVFVPCLPTPPLTSRYGSRAGAKNIRFSVNSPQESTRFWEFSKDYE